MALDGDLSELCSGCENSKEVINPHKLGGPDYFSLQNKLNTFALCFYAYPMKNRVFILLLSLIIAPSAFAQDMMSGLTPPKFQMPSVSYSGLLHQESEFPTGQSATSFQTANISVPFYKTEAEAWSVSLSGNQLAVSPPQGEISNYYDLKLGLGYTKALDDKRLWSASVRFGSASDRLFANSSVSTIGATWFYSYPRNETGRWLFLVDYSNNRPILNNIPLPGFAYFYKPDKTFNLVVGAPFAALTWDFHEKWGMEGVTFVPWVIKGSIYYKINDYAKIYSGLDFSQITYYRADRENNKDRIFFDEKKLFVGAKSPVSKNMQVELEAGHAFDRAFFEAEEYEIDPENPLTIGNAFYLKASMRYLFF